MTHKVLDMLFPVLLFIFIIGVLASSISNNVSLSSQSDCFSTEAISPFTRNLSQSNAVAITSLTNASGALVPASNYTYDFTSDPANVTLLINSSVLGANMTVNYTYEGASYVSNGASRILLGLIVILIICFFLSTLGSKNR